MIYEIKKAFASLFHPGANTNIIKLARNAIPYFLSSGYTARAPLTVYWSVNSICNLHCKMCDVGMANSEGTFYKNLVIDENRHEIDFAVFKSVTDELKDQRPYISINSTEPLLWKPLVEAVQYCTKNKLKSAVTTGGYTLPKKAKQLAEAGLQRLNVSLDGPPEVHNHIRGRKDSFEKVVEGIKLFVEAKEELQADWEVYINFTVSSMNFSHVEAFVESLKDVPKTQISIGHLWFITPEIASEQNNVYGDIYPVSESCVSEYTNPGLVDTKKLFSQLKAVEKHPKVRVLNDYSQQDLDRFYYSPTEHMDPNGKCLASWYIVQILADGRVMPFSRCHNASFGNVNEMPFMQIWNGEEMQKWREFIRTNKRMPMCSRCGIN